MAKSFKKFREEWEDDEWGDNEDRSYKKKKKQLEKRKANRKQKLESRWNDVEDNE
jgi:hypothetical protein